MNKYLGLFLAISVSLFAETKSGQISSDSSVQKSERQAVITLPQLGMQNYKYNFDVTFCPAGNGKSKEKPKCKSEQSWTGTFSKSDVEKIMAENIPQLVSKKYDTINLFDFKAVITTATTKQTIPMNLNFNFRAGSKDKFEKHTSTYLNIIGGSMQTALNKSASSRRNEMNERDEVSFARIQGKSNALTMSEAEWLKNSGFAFALYFGELKGSVTIQEKRMPLPTGGSKKVYLTNIEFTDGFTLFVYKFMNGKFSKYSEISIKDEKKNDLMGSLLSQYGLGSGMGIPATSKPTLSDSKEKILDTFNNVSKESMITLNNLLKEDKAFKIISPLTNVQGDDSILSIGCQEDIRIDHPFIIERNIDGKSTALGFIKIRKSGNNCQSLPLEKRENSSATAISGKFENGDLALEHPWTGVFGVLKAGMDTSSLELDGKDVKGGNSMFGTISIRSDLGYVTNVSALSEMWLDFGFGYGVGDDIDLTKTEEPDIEQIFPNAKTMIFNLSLAKRLYFGHSAIYTDLGIGGSYTNSIFDFNDGAKQFTVASVIADPFVRLGYNFSPNIELFGKVGYSIPVMTSYDAGDEVKINAFEKMELTATSAVNFSFGLSMHTNFAGVFSRIFSAPPSSVCKVTEKR